MCIPFRRMISFLTLKRLSLPGPCSHGPALVAVAARACADTLIGVDLSEGMLEAALDRGERDERGNQGSIPPWPSVPSWAKWSIWLLLLLSYNNFTAPLPLHEAVVGSIRLLPPAAIFVFGAALSSLRPPSVHRHLRPIRTAGVACSVSDSCNIVRVACGSRFCDCCEYALPSHVPLFSVLFFSVLPVFFVEPDVYDALAVGEISEILRMVRWLQVEGVSGRKNTVAMISRSELALYCFAPGQGTLPQGRRCRRE